MNDLSIRIIKDKKHPYKDLVPSALKIHISEQENMIICWM